MTKEQLHSFIENSKGNESNICQIHAIKGGKTVYEDCWRGFKPEDAGADLSRKMPCMSCR